MIIQSLGIGWSIAQLATVDAPGRFIITCYVSSIVICVAGIVTNLKTLTR